MKHLIYCILFVLTFTQTFGQTASSYFPAANGYVWYYKSTPIDTNGVPNEAMSYNEIDSLAGTMTYHGVSAKYTLNKAGTYPTIFALPYVDTSFTNFSGSDALEYFEVPNLDSIAVMFHQYGIDTIFGGAFNFINTFRSFQKWYTMVKFASPVNTQYTIFQYDTSFTYNAVTIPLRFLLKGRRLADEQITVPAGTYSCKPFLFEFSVNIVVSIFTVPLLTIPTTIHFAPNTWVVQSVTPTTSFDLTTYGYGSFKIPGLISVLIPKAMVDVQDEYQTAGSKDFQLFQNYPNPFNPETKIRYRLSQTEHVNISVYDLLGAKIAELLDETSGTGEHSITLNGSGLASGTYLLRMSTGNSSQSLKIVLLK